MSIKATMGEIGGFHDVGDADTAEPLGTKQRARRINDALAVGRRLFPAHSHCVQSSPALRCLTLDKLYDACHQFTRIMMIVM